jgi:hypothetical protein
MESNLEFISESIIDFEDDDWEFNVGWFWVEGRELGIEEWRGIPPPQLG